MLVMYRLIDPLQNIFWLNYTKDLLMITESFDELFCVKARYFFAAIRDQQKMKDKWFDWVIYSIWFLATNGWRRRYTTPFYFENIVYVVLCYKPSSTHQYLMFKILVNLKYFLISNRVLNTIKYRIIILLATVEGVKELRPG